MNQADEREPIEKQVFIHLSENIKLPQATENRPTD